MPSLEPSFLPRQALAAAILSFALPFPAAAGEGVWTPVGPDGGTVSALAAHPRDPRVVYAGTHLNGVFRSTDAGGSWQNAGIPGQANWVNALRIDPLRSNTVYAVTQVAVFKSSDGGRTWSSSRRGVPLTVSRLVCLAIDPRNPNRLYLGTSNGIFRSQNGGATWQRTAAGPVQVAALAVDPLTSWLYAVTPRGLLASQDAGGHWQELRRGLPVSSNYVTVEAVAHRGQSRLFTALPDGRLFRSDDRGRRWVRVGTLAAPVLALAFDSRTGRLYAGTYGRGVLVSPDLGSTWRPASAGLTDPHILSLATGPSAIYAGTFAALQPGGLFKSADGGTSWRPSQRGLSALFIEALAASPRTPALLFASAGNAGFYRSRDAGQSWQVVVGLPRPVAVQEVVFDLHTPSVYALSAFTVNGVERSLLMSDDEGESWQVVDLGDLVLRRLWVDRAAPGTLWGAGEALYRSDDRGATWKIQPVAGADRPSWNDLRDAPQDPRTLYLAGAELMGSRPVTSLAQVARSTDGGSTWQRREAGLTSRFVQQLAVDPHDPARLYAAAADGLFRSSDHGGSWEKLPTFPPAVTAVLASPSFPTTLYAASTTAGVLRSRDQGETWELSGPGLGPRQVRTLIADPHDAGRIYAATANGGVFAFEETD